MTTSTRRALDRRLPAWWAWLIMAALVVLMAFVRLVVAGNFPLPIGYGLPIVFTAFFRSRKLLWATTAAFLVLNTTKFFFLLPEVPRPVHLSQKEYDAIEGLLVTFDLLLIAGMCDLWIWSRQRLEAQNQLLESSNRELALHEEEIARQNEELQSQSEELERQSEELRVANEELEQRQKTLEILLSLSRSLNTDLSSGEIMSRICQTLGLLIDGANTAAAILERQDSHVIVRCHHGFGPGGLQRDSIPLEQSFAALILDKGRTGYIEDISLRPDLCILQPRQGEPMLSIIATPLTVRGAPMGSLEVYSRRRVTWDQDQVALIESLAAQASVSLEAAGLFETVSRERNRFEAVLRAAPIGITVYDLQGGQVRINPAGAALLNVPVDQTLSLQSMPALWTAYREGKVLEQSQLPILRAAQGQEVHAEEIELVLNTGRRLVLLTYARPIRNADGKPTGAVSVFIDISAHKELQRELDLRRREAEEASVRKTRFLAAVSHDIRTPANAISLLAELIRRTSANPALAADIPELAQELHSSASSLVNLLSDVLDIARFDSDRVDLLESEFPLSQLLAEEHKHLLPLARQKGISLQFDAPTEPIFLRTDRIKLSRVLGNLVGNAIKFTESGGVQVTARLTASGSVEIAVIDTGIGMAPEYLPHIFDEFFQLRNPERDRTKGSGLGLTICKRLVDAMGGTLHVISAPGKGSTFTVELPVDAVVPQPRPSATSS